MTTQDLAKCSKEMSKVLKKYPEFRVFIFHKDLKVEEAIGHLQIKRVYL